MHEKNRVLHRANRVFLQATLLCGTILAAGTTTIAGAAPVDSDDGDRRIEYLKSLKIEDLLRAEITSVSKKPEKLADAAAAVFVITAEDIERAGARSIPEALRMAPGLQVAQISANKWVVSARGFADLFSNKLLVLIDGRSVYTPLFSGVLWELQDTLMEDIDRIEVIRGPGATLWGANAVNGVINIITKSTDQTQGALLTAATGSRYPVAAGARYGDRIGDKGSYRLYTKGDVQDGYVQPGGEDAYDGWQKLQSGFRADVAAGSASSLTVQGDVHKGEEELAYSLPGLLSPAESQDKARYWGGNLLTRWEMERGVDTLIGMQAYYDYSNIDTAVPSENRHTFDLDFQYRTMATSSQDVVWGLGYRRSSDDIGSSDALLFVPESKSENLYSAFLQDEITLADSWWLTLGSKVEHNDYSGFELQPTIRLRWKPEELQTVWGAISRAVRTPSRADHDVLAYAYEVTDSHGVRYRGAIIGQDDFQPEELVAYELGHRWSPTASLSFDTAVFYNVYENLLSLDRGSSYIDADARSPYLVIPSYFGNDLSGTTHGVEVLATLQPVDFWKLAFGYSYIKASFEGSPETVWSDQQFDEDDFPEHQFQLRSWLDLPANWSLDSELYYVDDLTAKGVDAYIRLDLRLGWQVDKNLKLSLSGENLTDSAKMEFPGGNSLVGSEVPRQFYAKLTWSY